MEVTILGSGTSTGVPAIQCKCSVCISDDLKNKRLRASAWLRIQGQSILIDTSTDLRTQALRADIKRVDAVLYTHPHADHIHGIDELRSFNFIQRQSIPVYGNHWTSKELKTKFSYIFHPGPVEGGGIPQLTLNEFDPEEKEIRVLGIPITPIPVPHGTQQCVGYRIHSFAYVTDCNEIPEKSLQRMRNLKTLVLDCVREKAHATHLNLEKALWVVNQIRPTQTYLTHLSHDFDYSTWMKRLPSGVALAYDGLVIHSSQ